MTDVVAPKADYWDTGFVIDEADLEHLYNHLLETETPLTTEELAQAVIAQRVVRETEALKRREAGAVPYLPKESYAVGQRLAFSTPANVIGTVTVVRPGTNPEIGDFDVLTVEFDDDRPSKQYVGRLAEHPLNHRSVQAGDAEIAPPEELFERFGAGVAVKLEERLHASSDIVRLAGRWFPKPLLASINEGHLNLAEAVLDMAGGGPLPTEALLKEIGLPVEVNPQLQVFSLNYALRKDERFDEVGPAGQVLWHLRRLEPDAVQAPPQRLVPVITDTDVVLTPELSQLANEIEDEWTTDPLETAAIDDVQVILTFPHRRAGTLPLTPRLAALFPTAQVTERVRFTLVDSLNGERLAGWVVRPGRYVVGLAEWYDRIDMPVGGLLNVRRGERPDEIVLTASRRRPTREWVRTAATSSEGRLAFSMQKKQVSVNFDDLMVVAVDQPAQVDELWQKLTGVSFERLVVDVFRELAKLNPQSAVHARSLYAAVNVARRCPPAPIFAELVKRPYYTHVGDAYWRFDPSQYSN
ncbi:MAG TPA: hypothetical protein PLC98_01880 [Anaerolineales bacterium]|nr:hypothetical protein [Anaerolineales bacterium]